MESTELTRLPANKFFWAGPRTGWNAQSWWGGCGAASGHSIHGGLHAMSVVGICWEARRMSFSVPRACLSSWVDLLDWPMF